MIGTRLGPYEITAKLGEGGMGVVYRAMDSQLGREVALKVLPDGLTADPERLARFEREAKLLAQLNHANIAHVYGLETGAVRALVMELVEGPTLAERLLAGPLRLEESLSIARQIAEALEAAHEKGIVHRDLKPQNVKAPIDAQVKVLDFGLAKAMDAAASDAVSGSQFAQSPTMTLGATVHGVILGTAAYMAPEQAAGGSADRRSDIWAFGVVLYEMLSGRRLFEGETVSHVLAGVLKEEPDFSALPATTPRKVVDLVRRCLRKRPRERLQAIGDARIVIDEVLAGALDEPVPVSASATLGLPRQRVALWIALAVLLVATAGLGTRLLLDRRAPAKVMRATVLPPPGAQFHLDGTNPGPVALSADGRQLAFTAAAEGKRTLWVRPVDSMLARQLPGTEGAQFPFWAPDGKQLGFFAENSVKKIAVAGGPPIKLCGGSSAGKGGSWSPRGVIVFTPGPNAPLFVVSAAGGEPRPLTSFDKTQGDNSHRHPRFLPDGEHFLFLARRSAKENELRVGSLDDSPPVSLVETAANAEYAAGRLLFVRDKTLMAQPFDPGERKLAGEAVPIVESILQIPSAALAVFSASQEGSLAYQTGTALVEARLVWRDRQGQELGTLGEPADQSTPRLSPDGRRVALGIIDQNSGTSDLWIYDVERNLRSRFTFDPASDTAPVWSPDGETLAFGSSRGGSFELWRAPVAGTAPPTRVAGTALNLAPLGWSPDGQWLVASEFGGPSPDLLLVPAAGGEPKKLIATEFSDSQGSVSPDGRWLAYRSNETGRSEIYVTTFPEPGSKWQVSQGEGHFPTWRGDGRELFYRDEKGLYAAEVNGAGATFEVGTVTYLFDLPPLPGPTRQHDGTRDGQRFLIVEPLGQSELSPITLVLNWPAELAN